MRFPREARGHRTLQSCSRKLSANWIALQNKSRAGVYPVSQPSTTFSKRFLCSEIPQRGLLKVLPLRGIAAARRFFRDHFCEPLQETSSSPSAAGQFALGMKSFGKGSGGNFLLSKKLPPAILQKNRLFLAAEAEYFEGPVFEDCSAAVIESESMFAV